MIYYCRELTQFSESEWKEKLQISTEELTQLILKNVFKFSRSEDGADKLTLSFVGEIATEKSYIASLPKCLTKDSENRDTVNFIRRALVNYFDFKKKAVFENTYNEIIFEDEIKSDKAKEIEVYLFLRSYFDRKGVYKRTDSSLLKSKNKKIDWKKTVQRSDVYLDGYSAFYPEPYVRISSKNENIISEIFKSVLYYLAAKYESGYLRNMLLSESQTDLSFETLINQPLIYCNQIKIELFQVFNSEDILMLKILHKYIEQKKSIHFQGINKVKLYGTNDFHIVWEYICSRIFDNQYNGLIKDFAHPRWFINNVLERVKGRFTPDILLQVDDSLIILDAKYYYPIPDNVCGASDVAKQLLYSQVSGSDTVKNIFIFPGDADSVSMENLGYVSIYNDKGEIKSFIKQRIIVVRLSLIAAIETLLLKDSVDSNRMVSELTSLIMLDTKYKSSLDLHLG